MTAREPLDLNRLAALAAWGEFARLNFPAASR
jgi:hypothetical protein